MSEAPSARAVRAVLLNLSGSETVAVGDGERGEYFRVLVRPGLHATRAFVAEGEGQGGRLRHKGAKGLARRGKF